MKKIILFLVLFCMMVTSAMALVPYTGLPQVPYIIYGHVEWNTQMLSGARIEVTNQNTGFTHIVVTDGSGYWVDDSGNWLTNSAARPPVIGGDVIKVSVTDGCGTADTCSYIFKVGDPGYEAYAVVDFSLTGTLTCPPTSCPSCSCGGDSSCYSGGSCVYTAIICKEKYPCLECPSQTTCPTLPTCPPEKICPIAQECPICPSVSSCEGTICPEEGSVVYAVIAALIAFVGGGGIVYITFGKTNKLRLKKLPDGTYEVQHIHPSYSGYHSINTIHRTEPHKKGEQLPKYEKDIDGVWRYQG